MSSEIDDILREHFAEELHLNEETPPEVDNVPIDAFAPSASTEDFEEAVEVGESEIIEANDAIPNESTTTDNIIAEVVEKEEKKIEELDQRFIRFSGASWFNIVQQQEIILAGLGGIGSWVSLLLSRVSPAKIYVFDDDRFESHNMAGQFVQSHNIGLNKTDVAASKAYEFSTYTSISSYPVRYTSETFTKKVMICGFDSMKSRKMFYENWKAEVQSDLSNAHEYLFIDGRLLAEEYEVFTIIGDDILAMKEYEDKYLFSDSEAVLEDCTLKQTSHMAAGIASKMVEMFISFCNNLNPENLPRIIPWHYTYESLFKQTHYEL